MERRSQFRRDQLIRIEREDPMIPRARDARVPLFGDGAAAHDENLRTASLRERYSAITRSTVDHDDLVGPPETLERFLDPRRLVQRRDDNRDCDTLDWNERDSLSRDRSRPRRLRWCRQRWSSCHVSSSGAEQDTRCTAI